MDKSVISTGFPGWWREGRLWNSKAQKVQWAALAILCLNLPPTTLLPSSCQVLLRRDSRMRTGRARVGLQALRTKKPKTRPEQGAIWNFCMLGTCPVTLDWVWVDGHSEEPGAHGVCPFQLGREYCLGRGRVWQGLIGQWVQACPSGSFSDVSLLFGACPFCKLPFSQVEGAEAEWQGWEAKGCYPGFLTSPKGGYPMVLASRGWLSPDSSLTTGLFPAV